ncbi:hypothetical protein RND81_12G007600 [Saponaria officinalis]|uniref:Uncharacterized protein n=1 Tax=Saponaria officinalis TaxID=3572 RepID=A0AAW1H4K1_SAPOF
MGGLGFRDLKVFNEAFLAKQLWRMFQENNSVAQRVFKAQYYKNSSILDAARGWSPSYTWRSLWGSKALLLEGLKWRVGDGRTIRVWDDAWLPGPSSSLVPTPQLNSDRELMVLDLICADTHDWNVNILEQVFE